LSAHESLLSEYRSLLRAKKETQTRTRHCTLTECCDLLEMQCVAVCCSVLQCVAMCCSVLHCVAVCCSVLQCVIVCHSVLQCVAVC